MGTINVSEKKNITFNEKKEPIVNGKKIGKWWGKTYYLPSKDNQTIHYKTLSLIGQILHHVFGYEKNYHRLDLEQWLEKNVHVNSNNKKADVIDHLFQSQLMTSDQQQVSVAGPDQQQSDQQQIDEIDSDQNHSTQPPQNTTDPSILPSEPAVTSLIEHVEEIILDAPITPITENIRPESLEATIAKLHEYKEQGYKLGIFIGRGINQSLPKEQTGWKWCSLDVDTKNATEKDRLHLGFDFNDQDLMQKIEGLFTTVALDHSVMKFIHSNDPLFNVLIPLLAKEKEVMLFTEFPAGTIFKYEGETYYDPLSGRGNISKEDVLKHEKDRESAFEVYRQQIGDAALELLLQQFITEKKRDEWNGLTLMDISNERKIDIPTLTLKNSFINQILDKEGIHLPTVLDQQIKDGEGVLRALLEEIFEDVEMGEMAHPLLEDQSEITHKTAIYIRAQGFKSNHLENE